MRRESPRPPARTKGGRAPSTRHWRSHRLAARLVIAMAIFLTSCGDESTPGATPELDAATDSANGDVELDTTDNDAHCGPCQTDEDCPASHQCVELGDGPARFCLATCSDGVCPAGTSCLDGTCRPDSETCSCDAQHIGRSTYCNTSEGCVGLQSCEATGLSACSPLPADAEICDGLDNDCDGETDELFDNCDDGNPCTEPSCVAGECTYPLAPNVCLIGISCVPVGQLQPGSECMACQPDLDGTQWTPLANAPCDDGDPCTEGDTCDGGVCAADSLGCDDGLPCTADSCIDGTCSHDLQEEWCLIEGACVAEGTAATPCVVCNPGEDVSDWSVAENAPCDDEDACTTDDRCNEVGTCVGALLECPNDDLECTDEVCENGDCLVVPAAGFQCFIDGSCFDNAAKNPSNACQLCNPALDNGGWTSLADETDCDDGSLCTTGEACAGGECTGGAIICECDSDAQCDDGDLCNGVETCNTEGIFTDWSCVPANTPPVDCSGFPSETCQIWTCLADTGQCGLVAGPNGAPCQDEDTCSYNETCLDGVCGGLQLPCDDANPCTTDACDPLGGCTFTPNDGPCDDGDSCTVGDTCTGGQCTSGATECACSTDADCPVSDDLCAGTYACVGFGNQKTCEFQPKAPCGAQGDTTCAFTTCEPQTGDCVPSQALPGTPCDDEDACTSGDTCQAGICAGQEVDCDDDNPCTDDLCLGGIGCSWVLLDFAPCSDGDDCTVGDQCTGGVCTPGPSNCQCTNDADCDDDGDACNGITYCDQTNPTAAVCKTTPPVVCAEDDTGPCLVAQCSPATGQCNVLAIDGDCDDGDACTTDDACLDGTCSGSSLLCTDGLPCTDDSCVAGECVFDLKGNRCLIDGACALGGALNPDNSCLTCLPGVDPNNWSPTAVFCNDGDPCTTGDTCVAGLCTGTPLCNDELPCTQDLCNDAGECEYVVADNQCLIEGVCYPEGPAASNNPCSVCDPSSPTEWTHLDGPCSDDDPCTTADKCDNGDCTAGPPLQCDDADPCTAEGCTVDGCVFTPVSGADCDDGNDCTEFDTCDSGECVGVNTCDCITAGDCVDDNACTESPSCIGGTCVYDTVICVGGDQCQTVGCNPLVGCETVPAPDGIGCTDGDPCTSADVCVGGQCQSGPPTNCDDGNECTLDQCNATTGCINEKLDAIACYTGPSGTLDVGTCTAGTRSCEADAEPICSGQIVPAADRCDALDNDCDGETDEAFPNKGIACDSPADADQCPDGVFVCADDELSLRCEVEADGLSNQVEACNGLDDDCDGDTDEGCDDDGDTYCDDTMAYGAGATCSPGDCNDDDGAINPNQADVPDLSGVDSNCDGVDGNVATALFVSADCESDDDEPLGTQDNPYPSIAGALEAATTQTTVDQILIAANNVGSDGGLSSYAGPISLVSGVGLYGGYKVGDKCKNSLWNRTSASITRIRTVTRPSDNRAAYSVQAVYLDKMTVLQRLQIVARVANDDNEGLPFSKAGMSTYGVLIRGGNVTLDHCGVLAGPGGHALHQPDQPESQDGAPGGAGGPGGEGVNGTAGTKGFTACEEVNAAIVSNSGGSGGLGGFGDGLDGGAATSGAAGGEGGDQTTCLKNDSAADGDDGEAGEDGDKGDSGASATDGTGSQSGAVWLGQAGDDGTPGEAGHGGGGGGGGGGGTPTTIVDAKIYGGGGGGGGGAGGCGGRAGLGGAAGGGSFAVFLAGWVGVDAKSAPIVLQSCTLTSQTGGNGGNGGQGSKGGNGGEGGDGGAGGSYAACGVLPDLHPGDGGDGGDGGAGGLGGHGGGGAGGASFCVWQSADIPLLTVDDSECQFGFGGQFGQSGDPEAEPNGQVGNYDVSNVPLQP